jgi:hypothetical protein
MGLEIQIFNAATIGEIGYWLGYTKGLKSRALSERF